MARRWIPRVCAGVFVGGVAGIIVATINGNNAGVVLSIGLIITFAATALLVVGAVAANSPSGSTRIDAFDEATAEQLEESVLSLVRDGADENTLRSLLRDARRLGPK